MDKKMAKLYLEKPWALRTTLLLCVMTAFALYSFVRRDAIQAWGIRTLLMLLLGLSLCCAAAMRDGYHLSVQHAIDGSVAPGLFTVQSLPSIVGGVLALVAVMCATLSIFLREARQALFFVMSGSLLCKMVFIEASRIIFTFLR